MMRADYSVETSLDVVHRGHVSYMNMVSCDWVPVPYPVQRLVEAYGVP